MPTTIVHRAREGPTPPTSPLPPIRHMQSRGTIRYHTSPTLLTLMRRVWRMAMSRSLWWKASALGRTQFSTSCSCLERFGSVLCSTTSTRRKYHFYLTLIGKVYKIPSWLLWKAGSMFRCVTWLSSSLAPVFLLRILSHIFFDLPIDILPST